MTEAQARSLVATLVAAFPNQRLDSEQANWWTHRFGELKSFPAASAAVEQCLRASRFFPTIAELSAAYEDARALELISERREGLGALPAASEPEQGPPPAEWHALRNRLGGSGPLGDDVGDVMAKALEASAGRCDDCGESSHGSPRYRYGKVTICRACLEPRVRSAVRAGVPA